MEEETNSSYLNGLWMACASWAKGVEEKKSYEEKATCADQAVKRILSLMCIAERHNSTINISLKPKSNSSVISGSAVDRKF